VELRGAEDRVLARISAINDAPATVTVSDCAGARLARSVRGKTLLLRPKPDDALTVHDADNRVAQLQCDGDGPWPVRDDAGSVVGELLAGEPGPSLRPRWYTWVHPQWALEEATYARGQHLGLRRVHRYTFAPANCTDRAAKTQPVGLALLPLLAGLTY
jgi:hypothetical protein